MAKVMSGKIQKTFVELYFWKYANEWVKCKLHSYVSHSNGIIEYYFDADQSPGFVQFLKRSYEKYPGQTYKYFQFTVVDGVFDKIDILI